MSAPSYTTDLSDITICESTTNFDESSNSAWDDGGGPDQEADYYIQGDYCVSEILKTGVGSIIYDYGSDITFNTGDVFMAWHYCIGPSALGTYAQGGMRMIIGDGYGSFEAWDVWGSDYYTYGGWICIPVDPTVSPDDTVGSPTGTDFFGIAANITGAIAKGNSHGVDVMRHGRAQALFRYGDAGNGYCTFAGFAAVNDNISNRWGILQEVAGGYLWQGLMSLGGEGSAGEAVDFRDSNKLIFIATQLKVTSSFNRIEINQSDSRVDWINIVFISTGGVSVGELEVMDDADVNLEACSFIEMNTLKFLADSTVENCNFINCGEVTQGGGDFDGCTFDEGTDDVALQVANAVANVTNCEFNSPGTPSGGHYGLEGFTTAGSYNLTGLTFNGFASGDGSTGYEAIHVTATSGTVTLNISGGSTPSVHSEGAIINKVINPVSVTVTVKNSGGTVIENARVLLETADGTGPFPFEDVVIITNADDSGGPTAYVYHPAHGLATDDFVVIKGASYKENNGVHQITVTGINTYTYELSSHPGASPGGTIKSTYAALYGLSNASGIVTTSKAYSANQNVTGWVRKSSGTPFYKTASIVGTVDSDNGLSATAILILDE